MLLALLIAQLTAAQLPASLPAPSPRTSHTQQPTSSVRGVVRDSIAMRALAGATVQLVSTDTGAPHFAQTVTSDSSGGFRFRDVPAGTYTLGFFHPTLDSLGIEPKLRSVTVSGQRQLLTDLAIPSAESLRAAVCGIVSGSAPPLLMGIVRDARTGDPLSGVTVAGEWVEFSFDGASLSRKMPRRVTTTRENGWFAICNVPSPGTIALNASRNADSTDIVEVQMPEAGFLRRELFLGSARIALVQAPGAVAGEPAATRTVRVGEGRLTGTVTAANSGRPLANAQVSIVNGPETRTNLRGEWTLTDAPVGTRALEVRSVGYYPERRTVDVVEGTPTIPVSLMTFKSVLDTMKVLANYDRYSNLAGFRERRRSGVGRYLAADDVAKRNPILTSDLFIGIPGVYVEYPLVEDLSSEFASTVVNTDTAMPNERMILLRGLMSRRCIPAIYINGQWIQQMSTNDIDAVIKPGSILGIEVYATAQTPPQFQQGMSGCGSIVFWM